MRFVIGQRLLHLSTKGYKSIGVPGRFLKLFTKPENWHEARKMCQSEGGDLVIVDHPLINDWLAKQDMKLGRLWIGATDEVLWNDQRASD